MQSRDQLPRSVSPSDGVATWGHLGKPKKTTDTCDISREEWSESSSSLDGGLEGGKEWSLKRLGHLILPSIGESPSLIG
eukprot:scaffold11103_cov117-Cylindrotheca_fusiformis.AAC.5